MPIPANFYDALVTKITPTIPIGAEYVGQVPLPFARYVEIGDSYTYFTKSAADTQARQVWTDGSFQISIFASSREQARTLGYTVMNLLDDYTVAYTDGRLMFLEPVSAIFIPEPHTGPNAPTVFHRAITFSLAEQRSI